jgi:hypothetical protein
MSPSDRVARLYPQAPGSLFVASYDLQGYGGGIQTRLHTRQKIVWDNLNDHRSKTVRTLEERGRKYSRMIGENEKSWQK